MNDPENLSNTSLLQEQRDVPSASIHEYIRPRHTSRKVYNFQTQRKMLKYLSAGAMPLESLHDNAVVMMLETTVMMLQTTL